MNRKTLFAFVAVGSLSTVCNAVTTWTGATSTDWHTASNWSPAAVPGSGTDVVIPSSLANYPQLLSGAASVNGLDMQNGASLQLGNYNFTVADADNFTLRAGSLLRLNGSGDLILAAGGAAEIAGTVQLETSTSAMAINDTVEFIGHSGNYGKIVGQHATAELQIPASEAWINGISVEGYMVVNGASGSQFVNRPVASNINSGRVSALSANTLEFDADTEVSDDSTYAVPLFQAIGAKLLIKKTPVNYVNPDYLANFDSTFEIDECGELELVNAYVSTLQPMTGFLGTIRTGMDPDEFFTDNDTWYIVGEEISDGCDDE